MRNRILSVMERVACRDARGDLAPVYLKANSLLKIVILLLYLASLAMAPIHGRWFSSVLIGLVAVLIPLAAMSVWPTALLTRLLVASSLMALASLQIHLLSGLVEAHFLIFILLSVLLAYRDWRTIIGGAVVIALHHLIFSYVQHAGYSVYVMPASHLESSVLPMVAVHAVYVVVQTIGLCIMARQMERDAVSAEELGRLSSHLGRREGVFDLGFDDAAMQSHLGDHFKRTMLAVRRTLQSVAGSIEKVSATSKNIADGTGELLSRSEEQGGCYIRPFRHWKA